VPGKHAPESPKSFYLSIARAAGGATVALGVIIAIALVAVSSHGTKPQAKRSIVPTSTATATVAVSPRVTPTPTRRPAPLVPHSKVSVNVLNGTAQNGLAGKVAAALRKQGYAVNDVTNAPSHAATTTIFYRPGQKLLAGRLLKEHPEFGKIAPASSTTPKTAFLTLVLGDDYRAPS
jgi:LytR cell envelope-related transcriptional attenuator